MSLINISICLSDIDKSKITEGKNGKKYINLTCAKNKGIDKFGNSHGVYITQSKEDRESGLKRTYVGNGKEVVFNQQSAASTPLPAANNYNAPAPTNDDLPF